MRWKGGVLGDSMMNQGLTHKEWLSGRRLASPSELLGGSRLTKLTAHLNMSAGILHSIREPGGSDLADPRSTPSCFHYYFILASEIDLLGSVTYGGLNAMPLSNAQCNSGWTLTKFGVVNSADFAALGGWVGGSIVVKLDSFKFTPVKLYLTVL